MLYIGRAAAQGFSALGPGARSFFPAASDVHSWVWSLRLYPWSHAFLLNGATLPLVVWQTFVCQASCKVRDIEMSKAASALEELKTSKLTPFTQGCWFWGQKTSTQVSLIPEALDSGRQWLTIAVYLLARWQLSLLVGRLIYGCFCHLPSGYSKRESLGQQPLHTW